MSQPAFRLHSSPVPDPIFYRSQMKHSRAYAPPAPPPSPPPPRQTWNAFWIWLYVVLTQRLYWRKVLPDRISETFLHERRVLKDSHVN